MANKLLLQEAKDWCDDNDKSTEFMIQYMQDFAGATEDEVMDFLISQSKPPSTKPQETEQEIEDYCNKFLDKFKQDPQYELKLEFGKFLLRHINDLSPDERIRYDELKSQLKPWP